MRFERQTEKLYERIISKRVNGEMQHFKERRVYPCFNRDGTINWFNLIIGGSWWKLLGAIIFVAIALGFALEYHNNFQACGEAMEYYNMMHNIISGVK